jgi:hypothetical protein
MGRLRKPKNDATPTQARLRKLELEYDRMFDLLLEDPSNEDLSREIRHIEIDIVRITGEKTIDY